MTAISHGTPSGYAQGCREACCKEPHADAARAYRKRVNGAIQRRRIEQAIARGLKPSEVMTRCGVTYEAYRAVLEAMEAAENEPEPDLPEPLFVVGGRPISSYFGPAAPEVIAELVEAICPKPCPPVRKREAA